MLNRRILRIKAFKTVYALAENPAMTPAEAQAQLEASCQSTRDLYLFMLAMVPALTAHARERIEAARKKFHPSEEELNPNIKSADNAIAAILSEDPDFTKIIAKKKLQWDQYDAFLWSLYDSVKASDYYASYMAGAERSAAEDAALWVKVFENELVDNDKLEEILETASIWWNDDLAYALSCCCRSLELIPRGGRWTLPPLYQSDTLSLEGRKVESDRDFSLKLLRCSYAAYGKYSDLLSSLVSSFEKDRLVSTDVCLMVCCLAEVMNFDSIPARVSINEYVEISKFYGTPKSSVLVNGLRDRAVRKLLSESGSTKTL